MRLKSLKIKNFRALEDIEVVFDNQVNVIVGPNAVGKTTILEAIRLTKALLAPRTMSEPTQALYAIGAAIPQSPQELIFGAIARDAGRPVEIHSSYELTAEEINEVEKAVPRIAMNFVLSQVGQAFANPAASSAILSSPQGVLAVQQHQSQLKAFLSSLKGNKEPCRLDLTLNPVLGTIGNGDQLGASLIAFLDRRHAPNRTTFSYFPADRALPSGEQPIQFGTADAALQMESHMSQPQLKYARLKNTIFGAVIRGSEDELAIRKDFEQIFSGILKGRRLVKVGVGERGMLSIRVQDIDTTREFDIDGMSSGEKGLILTCLLIGNSMADGGLILIDEPELHLNPAVCRDLLSFLVQNYIVPKDLQAIICSHSPEILAGAFDDDHCSLFHLLSGRVLTKVRRQDPGEISDALRRLGTSESEGLLHRATIFVEGDDDVELIETGFGDLLRRYKVKDLGGRHEVEKQIEQLQAAESKGVTLSPRYFIFDRDETPTQLKDSAAVKILQWNRRCLENYLIDVDLITDLLKDPETVREPLSNQAEVSRLLQDLARPQLDELIAREVYAKFGFEGHSIRGAEIRGKGIPEIAEVLCLRLTRIKSQAESLDTSSWKNLFIADCEKLKQERTPAWEMKWTDDCDGKRLFGDLMHRVTTKMSLSRFKKRLMQEMRLRKTASWRAIESLLKQLVEDDSRD